MINIENFRQGFRQALDKMTPENRINSRFFLSKEKSGKMTETSPVVQEIWVAETKCNQIVTENHKSQRLLGYCPERRNANTCYTLQIC